ncbi:hypothetical protein F2Q69_00059724 [Brassica cretica]|uniref:Uncharacterized protein n=1 Tax=Brassica cretica TaxID=69181 RepID=A0A8S9RQG9_BRACR|nr:hypothetical protein F2Q69_00059724 [Brassica cretica]
MGIASKGPRIVLRELSRGCTVSGQEFSRIDRESVFWELSGIDSVVDICNTAQTHRMSSYGWRLSHKVMPVLPKSGQSASREEAVEEMKDCRSMLQHWCRSTVMPEYGLSIFYDR